MRSIRIVAAAADEAAAAAAWYERQRPGLGREFEGAIEAALDLLEHQAVPLVAARGAAASRGLKRLVLRRFPYDVILKETRDGLTVIAFAHHARRPGYWRRRTR